MRYIARYGVTAGLVVGVAAGCINGVSPDATGPLPPSAPPYEPPAMRVNAGHDLFVALPESDVVLRAEPTLAVEIYRVQWTKIAGPATYRINEPDRKSARVDGLMKGTYTFVVAMTDVGGRTASDTLSVHVVEAIAVRSVDFPAQGWQCPMGCSLTIGNVEPHIPKGAILRVLLRSGGATTWEEIRSVYDESYSYSFIDGHLELYAADFQSPGLVRVLWTLP